MTHRILLAVCLIFIAVASLAEEPGMGPIIKDYGPTYPIDFRDVALEEDAVYKVMFDLSAYPGEVASLNSNLVSVARYLNMHARNGVALENMDIAVVIHGGALKNALSHEAYQARYHADNPNLDLFEKLDAVGVKFYICGQSMRFQGFEKNELAGPAKVALSAMTMLTVLQNNGYALLPW
ncbi:MAG: DsrE family protein [Gammaproteobacteria bacterium]|nr:DsrE family protein [Gammaproteobacteria bacterium]